jgi:hypothetical protein
MRLRKAILEVFRERIRVVAQHDGTHAFFSEAATRIEPPENPVEMKAGGFGT